MTSNGPHNRDKKSSQPSRPSSSKSSAHSNRSSRPSSSKPSVHSNRSTRSSADKKRTVPPTKKVDLKQDAQKRNKRNEVSSKSNNQNNSIKKAPKKVSEKKVRAIPREHIGHIQKTNRKRAITAALLMVVVTALMLVVTASAILYVRNFVSAKPNFSFISSGSVEHSVGASALIVREEQVFLSDTTGTMITLATEGSRVAKSQRLAMIIPPGMEDTISSLNNVQQQIVDIERELVSQGRGIGAASIYQDTSIEMRPVINMIRSDSMNDNLMNLGSYAASIQVLMEKRDTRLQSVDFEDERLTTLRATQEQLERELAARSTIIYAETPGVVSYKIDSLEEELSLQALMNMLPLEVSRHISQSNSIIIGDLQINQGEPALRISQNEVQYIACTVPNMLTNDFPIDSVHVLRVPGEGITIENCRVVRSTQYDNGVFVVFETANQIERLLDRRSIDIEIIRSQTQGLRVPLSALINHDEERGVAQILINVSGYARSVTIVVRDYDREYAIIEPVEGFDIPNESTIVITNPHTISDGEKVEQ